MVLLTVEVPPGLGEGDVMSVNFEQQTFELAVPPGCFAGDKIEVDLPVESDGGGGGADSSASGMQQVELVVPDGVYAGDLFRVDFDGQTFEIACPDGCGAGATIVVELPSSNQQQQQQQKEEAPAPDQSHFKFQPGQRVELIRTAKGDDEVTSSGTIIAGFEGVFEVCYKVKLDNGMYKEAVPEDEISGAVTSDMGDLFGEW